jgi:hypothetical protein
VAINYVALKAELQLDPSGLGYPPLIAAGNDQGLADVLNFPRNGSTPSPVNNVVGAAITVRRTDITPAEALEAIDTRDFETAATAMQGTYFGAIMQLRSLRLLNDDGTNTRILRNISDVLQVADTRGSRSRLSAIANKTGSRGEQLFGSGTVLTHTDISRALRETPA